MDGINFLLNGKGDFDGKKKKKEEEKIEWKEPTEERADKIDLSKNLGAKKAVGWFKFSKKETTQSDQDKKIINDKSGDKSVLADIKKIKSTREYLPRIINTTDISSRMNEPKDHKGKYPQHHGREGMVRGLLSIIKAEEKKKLIAPKVEQRAIKESWLKAFFKKIFGEKEKKSVGKEKAEISAEFKKTEEPKKISEEIIKIKQASQEEPPHILKTNLAEGEIPLFFNWKKNLAGFFFSVMAACLLLFAAYQGLIFWEKQQEDIGQNKYLSVDLSKLDKSIKQFERSVEEVLFFQKKLVLAGELLNNHIYWANFLDFFSEITVPGIEYTRTIGGESGVTKYAIDAKAKDFKTILTQVNLMRLYDYIKKVEVKGGKMSAKEKTKEENKKEEEKSIGNKIDFKLEFELDPIIFFKGPIIKDIEPKEGAAGQYITIYGINFRDYDEDESAVKFYNSDDETYEDARIDFLSPCKNNWWHNSYIVVKVPDIKPGNWLVAVVNGEGEIKFSVPFKVNKGAPGPGICFISPDYGSEDQVVNIYGEGFGDEEGTGGAEYYDNAFGEIISWSDKEIKSRTSSRAQTGALKIEIDSGAKSNGLIYKRLD
jgi:hypothetical protein